MAGESKSAIFGAIAANVLIAISKFIAAFFTGSSAMISEGIHSLVDTSNGLLLLYGIRRSKRSPDKEHPFGYGKEIYFWSFVVAILIFALGGGIAIYEGIHYLQHPQPTEHVLWNYIVLTLAFVFEGMALLFALKGFRAKNKDKNLLKAIRKSKDSAGFAIIVEDFSALIGLAIALFGITMNLVTNNPIWDGIASIMIGVLLCAVSIFMANESRGLLLGEGATPEDLLIINKIIEEHPNTSFYAPPKTMHLGPDSVLLALDINFVDGLSTDQLEKTIRELELEISKQRPHINKIYIESKSMTGRAAELEHQKLNG